MKKPRNLPARKQESLEANPTPATEQSHDLVQLEEEISRQIGPLIPTGQRAQVVSRVVSVVREEVHRGPLPAPKTMQQYEDTCPGAADRIISMAEASLAAEIELAKAEQSSDARDRHMGMIFGFGTLVILVCASVASAYLGQLALATAFIGVGAFGTVGKFIYGRYHTAPDDKEE